MLTAYDAFAFCKEPFNLVLALIRRVLAAIRYDKFLEKPLYSVEHGYREQSNIKGRYRTDKLTGYTSIDNNVVDSAVHVFLLFKTIW